MPKPRKNTTKTAGGHAAAEPWRSRIVGHAAVDPRTLAANPANARRHPDDQRAALAASIREVGFVRSVTVNTTTGHVVDGHARLEQALAEGQPLIDVEYVELSEAEERLILAALDRVGEMAEVDPVALDALLREVEAGEAELQELLAKMAEDAGIVPPDFEPVPSDEQGRLDRKTVEVTVLCPHCGEPL